MAKSSGLPKGFDIGATKDDLAASPVQIGDYLEENLRREPSPRPAPVAVPDPQPLPVERPATRFEPVVRPVPSQQDQDEVPRPATFGARRGGAPLRPTKQMRLQINMSVEGNKAHEDLMGFIQSRSRQRDVKHAEVYQALAMALSEALPYLDMKSVPERGAWGSPTARSFISALKATFVRAIGELHASEHRQ